MQESKKVKKKKVTLTLSGGGMRTVASIGVIKYLIENNYEIKSISGTSGGAIVALLHACGVSLDEKSDFFYTIKRIDIFKPTFSSLFNLNTFETRLKRLLFGKTFLKECIICVTNVETGLPEYISSKGKTVDEMIKYVIASCSLVFLFKPVKIGEKLYIDGGYSDNLPNIVYKKRRIPNISLNVNVLNPKKEINPLKLLKRVNFILLNANMNKSKKRSDILLEDNYFTQIKLFDMKKFEEIKEFGYQMAKSKIEVRKKEE